eukprot:TRINITY_DN24559_c0_g1_i8.p3 TRINITY_DN24559_c0_g1~~TRINITY_DN24559_c0_g1_i8.p3  ORF type:complete len:127 (+),score=23.56 TRINITY_DN24559_c0_g1_i8:2-382(+)
MYKKKGKRKGALPFGCFLMTVPQKHKSSASAWNVAMQLLEVMPTLAFEADRKTYNNAVHACHDSSHWEVALSIVDHRLKAGVPLDAVGYKVLLQALGAANQVSEASALFRRAREVGIIAKLREQEG